LQGELNTNHLIDDLTEAEGEFSPDCGVDPEVSSDGSSADAPIVEDKDESDEEVLDEEREEQGEYEDLEEYGERLVDEDEREEVGELAGTDKVC
jgi:hypothetical protein